MSLPEIEEKTAQTCPQGGIPVVFSDCAAFYHEPPVAWSRGEAAVLLCSPWGYEELCARSAWREFADSLAAAGLPTLRFDYPGCGDSLGAMDGPWRLENWTACAKQGATWVLEKSGASKIILVGQGLGAIVAALTATERDDVLGLALLAGYATGKTAMRELAASAAILASNAGLKYLPPSDGGIDLLGFKLPVSLVRDFQSVDLRLSAHAPAAHALFVGRANNQVEIELAERFKQLGAEVETLPYEGYEQLLTNPTTAKYPRHTIDAVVSRLASWPPPLKGGVSHSSPYCEPQQPLRTDSYSETPIRFGNNQCFGVFCEPTSPSDDQAWLFLNCGANPHTGWRRMTVDHARYLAQCGIRSLRIDSAGIGDSPERDSSADKIYCDEQVQDTIDAIEWLKQRHASKIALMGVCSGAYLAFRAAIADARVNQIVIVNPFIFVKEASLTSSELVHIYSRSNSDYLRSLTRWSRIRRLLRGELPSRRQIEVILSRFVQKARTLSPLFSRQSKQERETHGAFAVLKNRGVLVSLITSKGDLSEDEIQKYFGKGDARLSEFGNVSRNRLKNADHTLTPQECVDWLRDHLLDRAAMMKSARNDLTQ